MDWGNASVAVGSVVITAVISQARSEARHGTRIESVEKTQEEHSKILSKHADQFAELPDKFVSRAELADKVDAIQRSLATVQRWLEQLLFRKAPSPAIENMDDQRR